MIPKATIKRIMESETKKRKMRIGKNAVDKMRENIEKIGVEISQQAKKLAKHAGRETVDDSDVKLVIK